MSKVSSHASSHVVIDLPEYAPGDGRACNSNSTHRSETNINQLIQSDIPAEQHSCLIDLPGLELVQFSDLLGQLFEVQSEVLSEKTSLCHKDIIHPISRWFSQQIQVYLNSPQA